MTTHTQTTPDTQTTHPQGATIMQTTPDTQTIERALSEGWRERWTRRETEARERITSRRRELSAAIRSLRKTARKIERAMRGNWQDYRDSAGQYNVAEAREQWDTVWSQIDALEHTRKHLAAPSHRAPVESYTHAGYKTRVPLSPLDRAIRVHELREYQEAQTTGWLNDARGKGRTLPEYLADRDRAALTCGGTASHVRSYAVAHALLGERGSRKLANHTYLERRTPDTIAVRYHDTDVVTFHAAPRLFESEEFTLNTGGFWTDSTFRRIGDYLPRGYTLERFTVPASAIRRGADMPREYYDVEENMSARAWYGRTEEEIERQEEEAMSGAVSSPFMVSALLSGAGYKRQFLDRAIARETRTLWTLTAPDGARFPFHDGLTLTIERGTI